LLMEPAYKAGSFLYVTIMPTFVVPKVPEDASCSTCTALSITSFMCMIK
jgi:hypothetical protein